MTESASHSKNSFTVHKGTSLLRDDLGDTRSSIFLRKEGLLTMDDQGSLGRLDFFS